MSELIGNILPDVIVEMTEEMSRAFEIEGCKPACHCCGEPIPAGKEFRLAVVETYECWGGDVTHFNDEMLCNNCTPKMLRRRRKADRKEWVESLRGGYSRPSLNQPGVKSSS